MSSNNNDNGGAFLGIAFVCAALWFMMIAAYAIACFFAVIFTILSFIAWHRPLRLGKLALHPHEARRFVGCGIVGAIGLPAFVIFCTILFERDVPDEWWFYIVTGGYAFGSIGLSMMLEGDDDDAEIVEPADTGPHLPAAPSVLQLPAPPQQPFAYASWEDEAPATETGGNDGCEGCAFRDLAPRNQSRPAFHR